MKGTALAFVMLAAAYCLSAQQGGREQFNWYGGVMYKGTSSSLNFTVEDGALVVSGTASGVSPGGGGGYIIESRGNLEFDGYRRLIVKVSGISAADRFDAQKLLKLELNKRPQQTDTPGMKNRNDPDYINAQNGEAEFNLSGLRNIKSINLVFFNCAVSGVRIEVFYTNN